MNGPVAAIGQFADQDQLWWLVARSGGIVALVLVSLSVVWGLLVSSRYLAGGPRPKELLDLHRFLGALSVIFTGIHLVGLAMDRFVSFSLLELFVPFTSSWRPVPVAFGVVAFWLLIAVQASSMAMKHLPRKWWKWIHLTSALLLPFGFIHAITAGTDVGARWFQLGAAALIGLVVWLTAWRAWSVPKTKRRLPPRPSPVPTNGRTGA